MRLILWVNLALSCIFINAANALDYQFVGQMVDVRLPQASYAPDDHNQYGYAPAIVRDEQGKFHMFYCSQPDYAKSKINFDLDSIRYVSSLDGRQWSEPKTILWTWSSTAERSTCDPSVVYFDAGDGPYYYLYYSGNQKNIQTTMYVARSATIDGPYQKWVYKANYNENDPLSLQGEWVDDPWANTALHEQSAGPRPAVPMSIIGPINPVPDAITKTAWRSCLEDGVDGEVCVEAVVDQNNEIIEPRKGCWAEMCVPYYGAGQQTVVVVDGVMHAWHTDDTADFDQHDGRIFPPYDYNPGVREYLSRIYHRTSTNGIDWSAPIDTNITTIEGGNPVEWKAGNPGVVWVDEVDYGKAINGSDSNLEVHGYVIPGDHLKGKKIASVEVKYDPLQERFAMFYVENRHKVDSYLVRRYSNTKSEWGSQGVKWELAPEIVCDTHCFTDYAHNPGASGNTSGHLIEGRALIVFGAPYDLNPNYIDETCGVAGAVKPTCSGNWDLYGAALNPYGSVWNEIPWGWHWGGMGIQHDITIGDYDGDGVDDRAIVDRTAGLNQWYILSSTYGLGTPTIPWGWQWQGMHDDHDVLSGDFDGNGDAEIAIVDRIPNTNRWYIYDSTQGLGTPSIPWGWQWQGMHENHDVLSGDFDGNGDAEIAIVDRTPNMNRWYIYDSTQGLGTPSIPWGWQWQGMHENHDILSGDFDGNGDDEIAIVDRITNQWFIYDSTQGLGTPDIPWGWQWGGMGPQHDVIAGDFDGDGIDDIGLVDRSTSRWYILNSNRFSLYSQ